MHAHAAISAAHPRLAMAAEALRATEDPRDAIATALADARALTGAPVRCWWRRARRVWRTAACDGFEPLSEDELAALVPATCVWRSPTATRGAGRCTPTARCVDAATAAVRSRASASAPAWAISPCSPGPTPAWVRTISSAGGLAGHTAAALTRCAAARVRDLGAVDP